MLGYFRRRQEAAEALLLIRFPSSVPTHIRWNVRITTREKRNANILPTLDLTYSTTELVNPPSWSAIFAPKNALSWHCYLNNHLIEFSKRLIAKLHLYKNYYSRPAKLYLT
jgi:hypothetical protein